MDDDIKIDVRFYIKREIKSVQMYRNRRDKPQFFYASGVNVAIIGMIVNFSLEESVGKIPLFA